jgi:hypothetical protein
MIIEEDEESDVITAEEKAEIRENLLSENPQPHAISPKNSHRRLKKSRSFRTLEQELQISIRK